MFPKIDKAQEAIAQRQRLIPAPVCGKVPIKRLNVYVS